MKNTVGVKYGKITLLSLNKKKDAHYYWNCICECGKEKIIRSDKFVRTVSCGCDKKVK